MEVTKYDIREQINCLNCGHPLLEDPGRCPHSLRTPPPNWQHGEFAFDGQAVTGPAEYMKARGRAKLDSIIAGEDASFNVMLATASERETVRIVLAALQTDYAGWIGLEAFCEERRDCTRGSYGVV